MGSQVFPCFVNIIITLSGELSNLVTKANTKPHQILDRIHFSRHNKHIQTVHSWTVSMCRTLRKLTNHVTDKNYKRVKRSNKILIVSAQIQSRQTVPNLNVNFSNLHGQISFIYWYISCVKFFTSHCLPVYNFSSNTNIG
jgi:hypothetical protein